MAVRPAAVAGTWYPSPRAQLTAAVDACLSRPAPDDEVEGAGAGDLVALVAPHAGLVYSGAVAGCGYRLLSARPSYDTIVLVGPSHYVSFEGAAIWPDGAFDTPFGPLLIDAALAADIQRVAPVVIDRRDAHRSEHSLEMQLPFLGRVAPETPIVPIVMGDQTRETSFALGDGLAQAVTGRRVLLVASSDLSHFHDAREAEALDGRVLDCVDRFDPEGLMDLLERRPDHACGGGPMVAVLRAAAALGATRASILTYADSGDVSGDKSSVVGYMSAAVWR